MFRVGQGPIECSSDVLGVGCFFGIVLPPQETSIWCSAMQFVR